MWYPAWLDNYGGDDESGWAQLNVDNMAWPDGIEVRIWDCDVYGNPSYSNVITLQFGSGGGAPGDFALAESIDPQTGYYVYDFSWTPSGVQGDYYVIYDIGVPYDDGLFNYHPNHNIFAWEYFDENTGSYHYEDEFHRFSGHYAIVCYNSYGSHDPVFSNLVDLNLPQLPFVPNTPGGFDARLTPDGISLKWNNNNNRETSYELLRYVESTSNPNTWVLDATFDSPTLGADQTSYVDESTEDGMTYRYTIAAVIEGSGSSSATTKSGTAATTAATKPEVQLQILFWGQNYTNNTTPIEVEAGQEIRLDAKLLYTAGVEFVRWSGLTPENAIFNYYMPPNHSSAKVVYLTESQLENSTVNFYFVSGSEAGTIETIFLAVSTSEGNVYAEVTFKVYKPESTITIKTNPPTVTLVKTDKGDTWRLFLGDKNKPGISFSVAALPANFKGSTQWVQVINSELRKLQTGKFDEKPGWHTFSVSNALDKEYGIGAASDPYPYATGLSTDDSPGQNLLAFLDPNYISAVSCQDTYTMWFQYTPPDLGMSYQGKKSKVIPVPVQYVTWSWSASATLTNPSNKWQWVIDPGAQVNPGQSTAPMGAFPQWNKIKPAGIFGIRFKHGNIIISI